MGKTLNIIQKGYPLSYIHKDDDDCDELHKWHPYNQYVMIIQYFKIYKNADIF